MKGTGHSTRSTREPQRLRDLRADLEAIPALVDSIMARRDLFSPAPLEPVRVLIRTDVASVDVAILRAWILTVEGIEPELRLEETHED